MAPYSFIFVSSFGLWGWLIANLGASRRSRLDDYQAFPPPAVPAFDFNLIVNAETGIFPGEELLDQLLRVSPCSSERIDLVGFKTAFTFSRNRARAGRGHAARIKAEVGVVKRRRDSVIALNGWRAEDTLPELFGAMCLERKMRDYRSGVKRLNRFK